MKKTFLTFVVFMAVLSAFSENVTVQTAQQAAQSFLNSKMGGNQQIHLIDFAEKAEFSNFYVFGNEHCFVIIAGDDCAKPVLGYSTEGGFNGELIPDNVKDWLKAYNDEITSAMNLRVEATPRIRSEWESLLSGRGLEPRSSSAVNPLITTHWHQYAPYNNLCPADPNASTGHAKAGCGAIAMAQFMNYWEHPINGVGEHSYTPSNHPEYGVQYVNFGETEYDWDNMRDDYSSGYNDTEALAVATLVYHCGVAVNMNYGPSGSACNSSVIDDALMTYFDYSPNTEYVFKETSAGIIPDETWIAMLKFNLDMEWPLIYRGETEFGEVGHIFICDGYDANDYFHINWGHGNGGGYGGYDGYFAIGSLYENWTNYSYNNAAIFNSIPYYLFNIYNNNDPLIYSINSDFMSVTVIGHVYGAAATGTIAIPETKTFNGVTYPVTAIEDYAFFGCSNLTGSLTIPNSVTSIGSLAFEGCSGFNGDLVISNSVTTIGTSAFEGCSGFTGSLTIPNSMTTISNRSFYGCSGFTGSLTIPNSVTTIGYEAFRNCSGFTGSLTIPNSVTTIGYEAFYNCTFNGLNINIPYIGYLSQQLGASFTGSLNIGNSVITIGTSAFEGFSGFTGDLVIPSSVTTIGTSAFSGCSGFTGDIVIPNSVTTIEMYAFVNCSGFNGSLTIGESVATIGMGSFSGCNGITSIISLAEVPPTLGYNSFENWNSNTPVYVPCGFEEAYSSISWGGFSNFIGLCGGTVTVAASPAEGGIVTGGGTFETGQSCTVTATANANYTFVNWTENGNLVTTNASYTFEVFGDHNLVAHFQSQSFTINASANPDNGGTITGGGTYNYGQTCTLTAMPASGYTFLRWTKDGTQVSTNASYSFTVTESANYTAHFELDNYVVSVFANPSNGGTVTGGGGYHYGENCTVTASANSGFTFINWTENGQQVSSNPNYTFTVTNDRNLVANFTSQNYVITASADPENGGTITGAGGYNYGETCTLVATSNNGYTFQNWTKNGTQVSTNPSYSFTVTESAYYVAHFNAIAYTISVSASPSEGGFVSGGGSYSFGQSCTVHATANPCYSFVRWTENGSYVSNQLDYSFTVTGNRNLVANFTINTYTITAETNPESAGIVTGSGFYQCGETCTLTVIPNDNYTFLNWTENETVVSNNPSVQFTVTGSRHLVANLIYYNGIDEKDASVELYPNPANDYLSIKGEGIIRVAVFNAVGQVVEDKKVERKDVVQIDVKDYAIGAFVVKIFIGDGVAVKQFMKY